MGFVFGQISNGEVPFFLLGFSVGAKILSVLLRLVFASFLAAVGLAAEVTVVRLSKEPQVLPGAVVVHIWEITNVGETALSPRLTGEAPTGWEVLGVPTEVLLPPNSAEHVFATILVPKTAAAGTYSVRLKVTWNGKEEVGEGPLVVRGVAALELRPPTAAASQPGETISGEVLLVNRGNAVDRVTMEAWTAAGWPVRVKPAEVPLAPGEGKGVRVEVEIPRAAEPGREVVFFRPLGR